MVQLWDTAGQEKFRSVAKSYFKNADGCIIVYDVNSRHTFKSIPYWMEEFVSKSRMLDSSMPLQPILILGNKIDLNKKYRQVNSDELEHFAEDKGLLCKEVSAKLNNGRHIQNSINNLIDLLVATSKRGV